MWKRQRNDKCNGCFARGSCGGECKIVSYNKYWNFDNIDPIMCEIKRHLFLLARYFVDVTKETNPQIYDWLLSAAKRIEGYYSKDERLIEVATYYKDKYTYSELKRLKDTEPEKFEEIYKVIH